MELWRNFLRNAGWNLEELVEEIRQNLEERNFWKNSGGIPGLWRRFGGILGEALVKFPMELWEIYWRNTEGFPGEYLGEFSEQLKKN